MGLFYAQRSTGVDHIASAIADALQEQPGTVPDKAGEAKKRAAMARQDAASESSVLLVGRVVIGVAIAAALIVGAVLLSQAVDNQAIAEAVRKVQTPAYVPPDLDGLKSAAEWLRTLGAAWSAALVAAILAEKTATTT